jgi:uncharacterized membrane protein YhaH (DUF805 family)
MTIIESVKHCYKNYAVFNGRAKRPEYWFFALYYFLISVCLSILDIAIFPRNDVGVLSLIFAILNLLPYIAVTCRRLHDTNRSGWWQGLPIAVMFSAALLTIISETLLTIISETLLMIGVIGGIGTAIMLIVWLATIGDSAKNRFGPSIR